MGSYVRPTSLREALECRADGADVLAGGTDFWPARVGSSTRHRAGEILLDLTAVGALRGIVQYGDTWRIGALTTWTELAETQLPPAFHAAQMAAVAVGGRQIQNRGTIGGNVCNASPAADGIPPLLALDAAVELTCQDGVRTLPLAEFLVGPRRTALAATEVLTALLVRTSSVDRRSHFIKLGARRYQVISILMGAALITTNQGHVAQAALAIGAGSPVALRLTALEHELVGRPIAGIGECVTASHLDALAPITDIRGDAIYRRDAALVVVRRLLNACAGGT